MMAPAKFFTRFDPPKSPVLTFSKPSLTEQSHRRECNINFIIDRYKKTGVLGSLDQMREMYYGDFSKVGSFHEAQNVFAEARENFLKLPSNVRESFGNDVTKFLDALKDNSQLEKFIDLGLIKRIADGQPGTPGNAVDMQPSKEMKQAIKLADQVIQPAD